MTGYIRKDTTNNIADGNVINATDLDNEFDGVQAAFVVATGHTHDGTASEGAAITKIGPVQDVVVSIASMSPKTTNTIDLGTSSLKYKDAFFAGNETVGGTLAVTGVTTLTAQPVLSSLTASQAVFTDASKGLVSNAITGTGNVVMSTSPTLVTPILGTPASGTVTNLTGTASININGTVGATTPAAGSFTNITGSANAIISVTDNTNAALRITQLGLANALLVEDSANPDSTPVVIDASGRVVVGYTAPITTYQHPQATTNFTPSTQIQGVNVGATIAATAWSNVGTTSFYSPAMFLAKSASATIGTQASVVSGEVLGTINFSGDDGSAFVKAAQIIAAVDGTPGTNDMPGRLVFSTTADGASSPTERMRIDSTGNVGIGTTAPLVKLEIAGNNNTLWIVTASISGVTMDVTAVSSGTIAVGDLVYGTNIQPYTRVTALGTGTGGVGTYTVSVYQTVASSATTYGTTQYGATLIRITDIDTNQAIGQPNGALQFFTSDASTPTAGVSAYVAALAEGVTPDTSLVFGTRDNAGGGVDANERMRIDSSGNLGLGVVPSAWISAFKAMEFANAGSVSAISDELTVAANSVYLTGTNWTYKATGFASQYRQSSSVHKWYTAPSGTAGAAITFTQAMTLTAAGNLGIGTSSPSAKLEVAGSIKGTGTAATAINGLFLTGTTTLWNRVLVENTSGSIMLGTDGSTPVWGGAAYAGVVGTNGSTPLQFMTTGQLRATLDSSGNLGLGVTPSAWVSSKALQVSGAAVWCDDTVFRGRFTTNTYYGSGGYTYLQTNQALMYAQNGANGQHQWYTAPSGTAGNAITFTQAMTLLASGNLLVGTTAEPAISAGSNGRLAVAAPSGNGVVTSQAASATGFSYISQSVTSAGTGWYHFYGASGNGSTLTTNNIFIYGNGNIQNANNSYGAISDLKLKENIADATPKLAKLLQVQVRTYNLKGDYEKHKQIGVVAQELETVFPGMVEEIADKDASGNNLGSTTKSVKYSVFVPILVKAIQEQQALIESLTQRLTALESK